MIADYASSLRLCSKWYHERD